MLFRIETDIRLHTPFIQKTRIRQKSGNAPTPRNHLNFLHHILNIHRPIVKNNVTPRLPNCPNNCMPNYKVSLSPLDLYSRSPKAVKKNKHVWRHNQHQTQPLKNCIPNNGRDFTVQE
ncbi:hypothetical protein QL285_021950 [Trifolium repens]|nr:hypothetical protein QL285_021950 [Trifolium repens]